MLHFKIQFQKGEGQIVLTQVIFTFSANLHYKILHVKITVFCYSPMMKTIADCNIKCVAPVYRSNYLKWDTPCMCIFWYGTAMLV